MQYRIAAVAAAALIGSTAVAQTSPSAPASLAAGAKTSSTKSTKTVVRTTKSLDCSKQADARSLHGKPRKNSMSSCKHG